VSCVDVPRGRTPTADGDGRKLPSPSAVSALTLPVLRIHFQDADLARVRVAKAPDPLWETVLGLYRLGVGAAGPPVYAAWQRRAKAAVHEQNLHGVVGMLRDLVPKAGYFPDFLTPAEAGGSLDDGLAALRDTPTHRLAHDIRHAASTRRLPAWTRGLADGDRAVLGELAHAMGTVHGAVIRPVWEDIEAAVGMERALRGAALLDGGVQAMLTSLRPVLRWEPPVLSADYPLPLDVHLGGRGLLLIPSYFCWGKPVALVDPALPPVLVYPVEHPPTWLEGVAGGRAGALAALLGRTRAAVLAALGTVSTSTELAARLGISTASASEHVGVLRDAGLVASHRAGRTVRHTLTPLGSAVLGRTFRA
jgi:DNA-binding transcriptional ArsR family regulator